MSNILDSLTLGLGFILFVAVATVALFVGTNTLNNNPNTGQLYKNAMSDFFGALNNVAIFIVIAIALAAVGAAFLIRSHPMYFIISVFLTLILWLVFPPIINGLNPMLQQLGAASTSMTLAINLMQNLPIWTTITSFLAAVVGMMRAE